MGVANLAAMFERIGARVKVRNSDDNWRRALRAAATGVRLDVRRDAEGEFFEVFAPGDGAAAAEVEVLHVAPRDRHLLLLVRQEGTKSKFLCGHDERHWFVAALPEAAGGVGTVATAKEALKPEAVRSRQEAAHVPARHRQRRKNAAFRRQGEWFFLPAPGLVADPKLVLKHEALRRGGGKPHWAEELYRRGGESVMFSRAYPNGLAERDYRELLRRDPVEARRLGPWRAMRRNMDVYVRGTLRHADHKTMRLPGWHRVLMNTESQAAAMRHVAFLD
jgi:hypothetical protein